METALITSSISLIFFFIMSRDIAKIRAFQINQPSTRDLYFKYMFYDDKEKATEMLKDRFWHEVEHLRDSHGTTTERLKAYENIKTRFAEDFKILGLAFPNWSGGDTW